MIVVTESQARVLKGLCAFITENGYVPTVKKLAASLGISESGVNIHYTALKQKGYLVPMFSGKQRSKQIPSQEVINSYAPTVASTTVGITNCLTDSNANTIVVDDVTSLPEPLFEGIKPEVVASSETQEQPEQVDIFGRDTIQSN